MNQHHTAIGNPNCRVGIFEKFIAQQVSAARGPPVQVCAYHCEEREEGVKGGARSASVRGRHRSPLVRSNFPRSLKMALDFVNSIVSCIKYSLIAFNFFFVITGIILISVGAAVQAKYQLYSPILDQPYTSVPALLIAIGVIIFLVAFFGCCGALKENYCMTLTFSILLILIFILELAAGISGYVLRDRTESFVTETLQQSLQDYGQPKKLQFTELWDDMQNNLHCCGVNNYSDWERWNVSYPISCCAIPPGSFGQFFCTKLENGSVTESMYSKGCVTQVVDYVSSHASSLGAAGICFAILQILGILCACYLAKRSKNEYIP